MRVCFVGDSHIAALKAGWDLVKADHPDVEVTFFGAPWEGPEYMAFEYGRLIPKTPRAEKYFVRTSDGLTTMTPQDYDLIVIVSLGFSMGPVMNVYLSHRSDAQKDREGDFQLVSAAYFIEITRCGIERQLAFRLRKLIMEQTGVAVWNCAKANPCRQAVEQENPSSRDRARELPLFRRALECGDLPSLWEAHQAASAGLEAQGFVIVGQPEETLETPAFTRAIFAVDVPSFVPGVELPKDGAHMNAQYGAAMLRKLLAKMRKSPQVV